MLQSEIPFRVQNPLARVAAFLVGEAFLGFLAIIAVALALFQMWFALRPMTTLLVESMQWGIIGLFAVEYVVALLSAPSRRAFLLNPWRLVDLATILIPFLTLIPGVSAALRSSPVLRLVRLVRIVTLGLRVSGVVVRERARQTRSEQVTGPVEVCVVPADQNRTARATSWDEFLSWVKSPNEEPKWFNVSNLGRAELESIARAAGMPSSFLESHLLNATYPHLEVEGDYAVQFMWLIEHPEQSPALRDGLLLLVSPKGLVSLARHSTDLTKHLEKLRPPPELADVPFQTRMACSILQVVVEQNEMLAARFDRELGSLEDISLRESRPAFFEQTFRLKKELSAAQSDLWRLKGVLAELADQRIKFPGQTDRATEFVRRLSREVEYLYETIVNTREGLLSLIDLHLNIVSFDMNRVMRVLAVVSVLGLIPAVVGGLFGMNLIDNPWPWTLKQVAFSVCFVMTLCLYLFFVKGWLR